MSREIKFRVWDKDLKKMHICGENQHDSISFSYPENEAHYYNLQNGCGSSTDGSGTYELMQYTCLKDKHGKEIYEGDIVTFKYDTRTSGGYTRLIHNAAIEYGGEGGDYMRAGYTFKFNDARGNRVVYDLDWLKVRNIEVIGNIYKNPELLEETV